MRITNHVIEIARADDGDGITGVGVVDRKGSRVFHGAGVEGGNLVVGHVGDDVGAGGGFLFHDVHSATLEALVI